MTANVLTLKNLEDSTTTLLSSYVKLFISRAVEKFNLKDDELTDLWNNNFGDVEFKVGVKKAAVSSAPVGDGSGCTYIFKKGNEKGNACGQKCDPASVANLFCKKHLKHDATAVVSADAPATSAAGFIPPAAKTNKVRIAKNSFGNYEHDETHFVFARDTGKVIGKQEGDKVVPLVDTDMELVKKHNFTVADQPL